MKIKNTANNIKWRRQWNISKRREFELHAMNGKKIYLKKIKLKISDINVETAMKWFICCVKKIRHYIQTKYQK